jgi:tRNA-dihydrouridine synthase
MQDVTTLGFMRLLKDYGVPDLFVTEFFRVHETSTPEKHILASIVANDTGRPVFAQLIGEDIPHMVRTVGQLLRHPVAGIDLNLGCPAPKVYRKNVGGGLLRDISHVDALLGALRAATPGILSVKMRIGFEDTASFLDFLSLINKHRVDWLTVHGRTVKGLYRSAVDYDAIALAVRNVTCPVVANGDITSPAKAAWVLQKTGCAGLMIGRNAIRNPWIFRQVREFLGGKAVFQPTLLDVRGYIDSLAEAVCLPDMTPLRKAARLKKFLNFVGMSVDPEGAFLKAMRLAQNLDELLRVSDEFLVNDGQAEKMFSMEPYPGVVARPNCEQGCEL